MTSDLPSEPPFVEVSETVVHSKRWVQICFLAIAILFNLCLGAQLLTVGLAVFSDPIWWRIHVLLIRGYGGLVVLLFVCLFLTPFSDRIQALTKGITILLILQFVTANISQPLPLGVLHPLIGASLFTTSATLIHRVIPLIRVNADETQDALWK